MSSFLQRSFVFGKGWHFLAHSKSKQNILSEQSLLWSVSEVTVILVYGEANNKCI